MDRETPRRHGLPPCYNRRRTPRGDIAQLGERGVRNAEVGGSSPPISTSDFGHRLLPFMRRWPELANASQVRLSPPAPPSWLPQSGRCRYLQRSALHNRTQRRNQPLILLPPRSRPVPAVSPASRVCRFCINKGRGIWSTTDGPGSIPGERQEPEGRGQKHPGCCPRARRASKPSATRLKEKIISRKRQDKSVGPAGSSMSTVFVGRQQEISELSAALNSALSGRGRLVMLVGQPGIGKTRTSQQLGFIAEERGAQVLWGRCYERPGAPPYWPPASANFRA